MDINILMGRGWGNSLITILEQIMHFACPRLNGIFSLQMLNESSFSVLIGIKKPPDVFCSQCHVPQQVICIIDVSFVLKKMF